MNHMRVCIRSTDSVERELGFRHLPRPNSGSKLATGFMIAILVGLACLALLRTGQTSIALTVVALFCAIFAACDIPEEIKHFRKIPVPAKPVIQPLQTLPNGMHLVEFGASRCLAVGIKSFAIGVGSKWLELMPSELCTGIYAMLTTGAPSSHENRPPRSHSILFVEIKPDQSPDAAAQEISAFLLTHEVQTELINSDLFAATVSHDWWFSHFYAKNVRLLEPVSKLFSIKPEYQHTDLDSTIIVRLQASFIGNAQVLELGIDAFVYGETKNDLLEAERRLTAVPKWTGHPIRHSSTLELLRRAKAKSLSFCIEPPVNFMHRFERLAGFKIASLSEAERAELHELAKSAPELIRKKPSNFVRKSS